MHIYGYLERGMLIPIVALLRSNIPLSDISAIQFHKFLIKVHFRLLNKSISVFYPTLSVWSEYRILKELIVYSEPSFTKNRHQLPQLKEE